MSAGLVVNVTEATGGSELVADVSAGASTITVDDPTDFNPEGGDLLIGSEEKAYSLVDETTGAITLDTTLANAYLAEDRVTALPAYVERFAYVQLEEQDETLQARVPHALYDRLTVGTRDINLDEGELVELERDPSGELIVADVIDRAPLVDPGFLDPDGVIPPEAMTDGLPPAISPTPTVLGGVLSLFVSWLAVSNPDPVTYEVHVSTSSGFTPTGGTLAGESRGTLFVIRHLPGTTNPPAYGTTYFVRLIAKDADGAAAVGAEDSATPEEGMASAIIADLIAANAVLAEKLEAVLVLASTLVAGTLGAGRVELGIATDESMGGMIGIHAVGPDGMTLTFMVDAETGEVFVYGAFSFGTGSSLSPNDIIELQQQPTGSFEAPILRQSAGGRTPQNQASTVSASWTQPTLQGSTLIMVVACSDLDGTPPAFTTPSGWTLVSSSDVQNGAARARVYKIENAAPRSGGQTVTLGDTVHATVQLFEYQGVGVQDVAIVTGNGATSSPAAGPTSTPTQSDELVLAGIVNSDLLGLGPDGDADPPTSITGGATLVRADSAPLVTGVKPILISSVYSKHIVAAATQSIGGTLPDNEAWLAWVVTFKAKTAGVENPAAGKVRIFGRQAGGEAFLHTRNDQGVEGSVALGTAGEVWRFEYVPVTIDPPSLNAHSAQALTVTVPGLAVGDLCFHMGADSVTDISSQTFMTRPPLCSTGGQIIVLQNNTDAVTRNTTSGTHHFLVIHRGSP